MTSQQPSKSWITNRIFTAICLANIGFSIADCTLLGIASAGIISQEAQTKFLNVDKGISLWFMDILLWIGFVILTKKNVTFVYLILLNKDRKKIHIRVRTIANMMVVIPSILFWSFFIIRTIVFHGGIA